MAVASNPLSNYGSVLQSSLQDKTKCFTGIFTLRDHAQGFYCLAFELDGPDMFSYDTRDLSCLTLNMSRDI